MTPVLLVAREVMELVRARAWQRAAERVRAAQRVLDDATFEEAQRTVQALNLAIFQAKREQCRIREELERLGASEELAGQLLRPVVDGYFDAVLVRLRREKAWVSDPRRRG